MTVADVLFLAVVSAGLAAFGAFILVAVASDARHRRYPGTKGELIRDCVVMNTPGLPFAALLLISFLNDTENDLRYVLMLALSLGFALAIHFLPPVRRARERFKQAYGSSPP